eukprot:TRINITY_DN20945_c0_g1_i1.p1 TRINITY_DN20945_c0_g1~~TRINITY_DN20945_c0_g1_i1.p1  ORF type:complete len:822 (+),score=223.63 TRINITY_DN20945_c0_g1_i1:110-2575(+)
MPPSNAHAQWAASLRGVKRGQGGAQHPAHGGAISTGTVTPRRGIPSPTAAAAARPQWVQYASAPPGVAVPPLVLHSDCGDTEPAEDPAASSMEKHAFCWRCGGGVPGYALFCMTCGARMPGVEGAPDEPPSLGVVYEAAPSTAPSEAQYVQVAAPRVLNTLGSAASLGALPHAPYASAQPQSALEKRPASIPAPSFPPAAAAPPSPAARHTLGRVTPVRAQKPHAAASPPPSSPVFRGAAPPPPLQPLQAFAPPQDEARQAAPPGPQPAFVPPPPHVSFAAPPTQPSVTLPPTPGVSLQPVAAAPQHPPPSQRVQRYVVEAPHHHARQQAPKTSPVRRPPLPVEGASPLHTPGKRRHRARLSPARSPPVPGRAPVAPPLDDGVSELLSERAGTEDYWVDASDAAWARAEGGAPASPALPQPSPPPATVSALESARAYIRKSKKREAPLPPTPPKPSAGVTPPHPPRQPLDENPFELPRDVGGAATPRGPLGLGRGVTPPRAEASSWTKTAVPDVSYPETGLLQYFGFEDVGGKARATQHSPTFSLATSHAFELSLTPSSATAAAPAASPPSKLDALRGLRRISPHAPAGGEAPGPSQPDLRKARLSPKRAAAAEGTLARDALALGQQRGQKHMSPSAPGDGDARPRQLDLLRKASRLSPTRDGQPPPHEATLASSLDTPREEARSRPEMDLPRQSAAPSGSSSRQMDLLRQLQKGPEPAGPTPLQHASPHAPSKRAARRESTLGSEGRPSHAPSLRPAQQMAGDEARARQLDLLREASRPAPKQDPPAALQHAEERATREHLARTLRWNLANNPAAQGGYP